MIYIDILAGTLIGALSGMGVGGAGLLVIYLTALRGISQTDAQGINLYFFIFASAASMFVHVKKRKINYENVLFTLAGGLPAAWLGCILASVTSPAILRKIFGGVLILTGVPSFFKGREKRKEK